MPLDPRIPLMGNIYQPDFGEIAQNRAQSMNVLSQMRQRDQELAQQNQFAEYVKGGGLKNNPLGALQFNEAGQQALSALTNYEQMKTAQDKAAREAEEATQKRRAEGRARSAWFFLNSDGTPEDLEQANAVARQFDIDDDEIAQTNSWIASQKDPKQALKGLALTDENVRKAMEAVAPKIEKVDAGDKWIFRDVSPMSPTFNQNLGTIDKNASPDAIIAATTAANAQANQLVIAQMKQAAKPSLSATEQKDKIQLESNLSRAEGALNALNTILAENLIQQSPAGLLETAGSIAQRSVNAASNQNAALARLGVLADKILKNVERFEGPQGVYDVKSYEKAAGDMANPLKSDSERLASAQTLIGLMEQAKETTLKRLAQYQGAGASAGAGAAVDFNDLD